MSGLFQDTQTSAPNPTSLAQSDFFANNFNQFTPFGNLEFQAPGQSVNQRGQPTGFNTQASVTQTLPPELQEAFGLRTQLDTNALQQALSRLNLVQNQQQLPSSIDFSGIPGVETDFSEDRAKVEQALFDRGKGLLDPVFSDQEEALRSRLFNQGIPEASQAASGNTGALTRFEEGRNEAFQDLSLQAVLAGGQEQSRLFGLNTDARNQMIGDQLRDIGLQAGSQGNEFNQLASLLGLQQLQTPGLNGFFAPTGSNVLGAQGLSQQVNLANANQNALQNRGLMSGLFGLGSAALGPS